MEVEALRESLDQLKLLRTQAEGLIGRISNNFKTDALLNVGIAKEAIDILQKTIIEQEKILSVQELTDINKISYMADVEKAIDELLEQNKLKQQRHDILLILGRLLYITGDENVEAVKTEVSEFMAEAKSLPIDNFIEKADKYILLSDTIEGKYNLLQDREVFLSIVGYYGHDILFLLLNNQIKFSIGKNDFVNLFNSSIDTEAEEKEEAENADDTDIDSIFDRNIEPAVTEKAPESTEEKIEEKTEIVTPAVEEAESVQEPEEVKEIEKIEEAVTAENEAEPEAEEMPELPADEKLEEEQETVTDSFPEVKVTHYYADVELEDDDTYLVKNEDIINKAYEMMANNRIYCGLAYLKGMAEKNVSLNNKYLRAAFAVHDPMIKQKYNAFSIYDIYPNLDDDSDEAYQYFMAAAILRVFFYDSPESNSQDSTLYEEYVKPLEMMRNNTGLSRVLFYTLTFKNEYNQGIDLCADYRDDVDDEQNPLNENKRTKGMLLHNFDEALNYLAAQRGKDISVAASAGINVLTYVLEELKSRLDGSYDVRDREFYYIDFLRSQNVVLDENFIPVLDNKFYEIKGFDIGERIIRHYENNNLPNWNEIIAGILKNKPDYGSLVLIMDYCSHKNIDFTRPSEGMMKESYNNAVDKANHQWKEGFLQNLEDRQSNGQLDTIDGENLKKQMKNIMNEAYDDACNSGNYGFFRNVLNYCMLQLNYESDIKGQYLENEINKFITEKKQFGEMTADMAEEILKVQSYLKQSEYRTVERLLADIE